MSSVHKVRNKPNWICFYTDHTGRRRGKSIGTEDRKEAERVCHEIQKIEDESSAGTYARYSGVVGKFLKFLRPKRDSELASLQSTYVERYRALMIGKVSNATVNTHLKVLR